MAGNPPVPKMRITRKPAKKVKGGIQKGLKESKPPRKKGKERDANAA